VTPRERSLLLHLKLRSKRGSGLSTAEQQFVQQMFDRYPTEFGAAEQEVIDISTAELNPLHRRKA
jgi:hypothetical protein